MTPKLPFLLTLLLAASPLAAQNGLRDIPDTKIEAQLAKSPRRAKTSDADVDGDDAKEEEAA